MNEIETSMQAYIKERDSLRYLFFGGKGGVGKTALAGATAIWLAKQGKRVGLVCYSRGLARFLKRVVAEWKPRERPAYVGLFHELPVVGCVVPGAVPDIAVTPVDLFQELVDMQVKVKIPDPDLIIQALKGPEIDIVRKRVAELTDGVGAEVVGIVVGGPEHS